MPIRRLTVALLATLAGTAACHKPAVTATASGPAFTPAATIDRAALQPGVTLRAFQLDGEFDRLPLLAEGQTPNTDELRPAVDFSGDSLTTLAAPVLTQTRAFIDVPADDAYVFLLTSDDGSRLSLAGAAVINHDGRHSATPKESTPVPLARGLHEIVIDHFDAGGGKFLKLEWKREGAAEFALVPAASLFSEIDLARVVAPGVKSVADQRRPGDGRPVAGVHPSFRIDTFEVEGFTPMVGAMTFASDGRLIVGTFNPLQRTDTELVDIESKEPDKLFAVSGTLGNPADATVSVAAEGLYEPLGLCAVGDDLYVSHRKAITRLSDKNGDGFYETHEDVASGWAAWNYHQFTFGLLHQGGTLYAALSTAMAPPAWEGMMSNAAPNDPLRGSVLEVDLATKSFRAIAGGVRTPNGLGFGPEGALFYCDNQGTWMPTNQFAEVVPGRFYGHYNNTNSVPQLADRFPAGGVASIFCDLPRTPTSVDMVHNDLCNSPTQPVLVNDGPYKGQMLVGELTAGGIRRVFLEKVNGEWQGAAFQFSQGFSCGINRLAWGPGGTLFAGGIGAGGNWNWKNTRSGLDRLTPTGVVPFEMLAVRATPDGFEIEFTGAVARAWLSDAAHYEVKQWRYEPTKEYGGEKKDVETLAVRSATPSADGTRVSLVVPGLRAGRTVAIRTDPVSASGEPIWSTYAYYTLNNIPAAERAALQNVGVGSLAPAGGVTLIGAHGSDAFMVDGKGEPGPGLSQADLLASPPFVDVGAGDLVSRTSFGDCRLHVEWFCPPGGEGQHAGNSGIYLQDRYEVQVLGTLAGDRTLEANEAGAIYGVKAADVNASTGPETWQAYDIVFTAPRFEQGKKSADARMTVYWNGRLVQDGVAVAAPTGSAVSKGEQDGGGGVQVGPVRLQAHATAAEGPVRYRNVWVAPLAEGDNGGTWRNLVPEHWADAFVVRGGLATYTFENGEIVGTTAPSTPNTFLVTKETYSDFELLLEAKQDVDLNSGIQIRSTIDGAAGGLGARDGRVRGYQVELDPSDRAFTGGIYDEGRRGWLMPLTCNPAARSAFKRGDWNQIRIVAKGPVIRTWVNGVPAASMFDAVDASGRIGLQVHGVGDRADPLRVQWRNIRIRPLGVGGE